MKKTKSEYLAYVKGELGFTNTEKYLKDMKSNYVILEDGKHPVCWNNGFAVIFANRKCDGEVRKNDLVITEQEYYNDYLD